jgi:hypothetical protein
MPLEVKDKTLVENALNALRTNKEEQKNYERKNYERVYPEALLAKVAAQCSLQPGSLCPCLPHCPRRIRDFFNTQQDRYFIAIRVRLSTPPSENTRAGLAPVFGELLVQSIDGAEFYFEPAGRRFVGKTFGEVRR